MGGHVKVRSWKRKKTTRGRLGEQRPWLSVTKINLRLFKDHPVLKRQTGWSKANYPLIFTVHFLLNPKLYNLTGTLPGTPDLRYHEEKQAELRNICFSWTKQPWLSSKLNTVNSSTTFDILLSEGYLFRLHCANYDLRAHGPYKQSRACGPSHQNEH